MNKSELGSKKLNSPSVGLRQYVGSQLKLKEAPTGYVSQYSDVKVGRKYRILDVEGCCLIFMDDNNRRVSLNHTRFDK